MCKLKVGDGVFRPVGRGHPTAISILVGCNKRCDIHDELSKIDNLVHYPIDIVSDVSTIYHGEAIWRHVVKNTPFIAATLPIYSVDASKKIDSNELVDIIALHAQNGVGLITIHPTVHFELIEQSKKRVIPFTSRGGGIVIRDMLCNPKCGENIYLRNIDRIAEIAVKEKMAVSIGASFRSATVVDSFDDTQQKEMNMQIEIAEYLKQRGVTVIIESPGHAAIDEIEKIGAFFSKYDFPIMPLGPMPTDIAFEEDDTAAAIGAVLLGRTGCADILSVVTRKEHVGGVPSLQDVKAAISKALVAAHIIDMHKLQDYSLDKAVSEKRKRNNTCLYTNHEVCMRCGKHCPLKMH